MNSYITKDIWHSILYGFFCVLKLITINLNIKINIEMRVNVQIDVKIMQKKIYNAINTILKFYTIY
jgi:ACT domain-containing protein